MHHPLQHPLQHRLHERALESPVIICLTLPFLLICSQCILSHTSSHVRMTHLRSLSQIHAISFAFTLLCLYPAISVYACVCVHITYLSLSLSISLSLRLYVFCLSVSLCYISASAVGAELPRTILEHIRN